MSLPSYEKKCAADFQRKKIVDFSDRVLAKRVYLENTAAQKGKINTTLHHFDALIDLAQKIKNRFFKVSKLLQANLEFLANALLRSTYSTGIHCEL